MNMLKFLSKNNEGGERAYIDKEGAEIVSSYKLFLVANNGNGFDSWFVLNSLVEDITDLKVIKTTTGLMSLFFLCGVKVFNTVEVPQYVNFTGTKSQIKGCLEKAGREYGPQLELLKQEIEHSVINRNNSVSLKHIWNLS